MGLMNREETRGKSWTTPSLLPPPLHRFPTWPCPHPPRASQSQSQSPTPTASIAGARAHFEDGSPTYSSAAYPEPGHHSTRIRMTCHLLAPTCPPRLQHSPPTSQPTHQPPSLLTMTIPPPGTLILLVLLLLFLIFILILPISAQGAHFVSDFDTHFAFLFFSSLSSSRVSSPLLPQPIPTPPKRAPLSSPHFFCFVFFFFFFASYCMCLYHMFRLML